MPQTQHGAQQRRVSNLLPPPPPPQARHSPRRSSLQRQRQHPLALSPPEASLPWSPAGSTALMPPLQLSVLRLLPQQHQLLLPHLCSDARAQCCIASSCLVASRLASRAWPVHPLAASAAWRAVAPRIPSLCLMLSASRKTRKTKQQQHPRRRCANLLGEAASCGTDDAAAFRRRPTRRSTSAPP